MFSSVSDVTDQWVGGMGWWKESGWDLGSDLCLGSLRQVPWPFRFQFSHGQHKTLKFIPHSTLYPLFSDKPLWLLAVGLAQSSACCSLLKAYNKPSLYRICYKPTMASQALWHVSCFESWGCTLRCFYDIWKNLRFPLVQPLESWDLPPMLQPLYTYSVECAHRGARVLARQPGQSTTPAARKFFLAQFSQTIGIE